MYTVIGAPRTRTMRVLWMLEELGQDYEIVPAAPHSGPVRAGNPGGKIPVLHDGPDILVDSVAICTYLADKHGACTHPAGSIARAHQDAMTQFCVDQVEGALWTLAKNTFVNPEEHRCDGIRPVCAWEFEKAMGLLALHVADKPFATGDAFTIPDLLLGHCANWAANAKLDVPEGPARAYLARVRERPALARAIARGTAATETP